MESQAFLPVLVTAIVLVAAAVAAMAIGVMFRRPCLRGSCGGPAADPERSCATCPHRRRSAAKIPSGVHRV